MKRSQKMNSDPGSSRWGAARTLCVALWLMITVRSASPAGVLTVNLTQHWPNFMVPVRTRGPKGIYQTSNLIVDTGNGVMTFISGPQFKVDNHTMAKAPTTGCLALLEDYTGIQFSVRRSFSSCPAYISKASIGKATALVNFTVVTNVTASNPLLHRWNSPRVGGDVGLAYCNSASESCGPGQTRPPFFNILANASGNATLNGRIFGLDFHAPNASVEGVTGSMQLGGVKAAYAQSLTWYTQATDQPTYHEGHLAGLNMCGVSLLSAVGVPSWPFIVDTGFGCIGLPAEIYDVFAAWLNTKAVPDASSLPALAFSLDGSPSSTFYVPLSTLLVNASLFISESGVPPITVGGINYKLCVLRGDTAFNSPAPRITIGALALRSLYFAADYSTYSLAFASKLNPAVMVDHINNDAKRCLPQSQCVGMQSFSWQNNSCSPPPCSSYFFTDLDQATQTCVYNPTAVGFGLFFVVVIVIAETVSFFVSQFSSLEILHARERHSLAISKVDAITRAVGKWLTIGVDWLVTFLQTQIFERAARHRREA